MTNGDDEGGRRVGETSCPSHAERLDDTEDTAALAVQMEDPDAPRPHIDVQAMRAELERLFPEPPGGWPPKPPDYPDTSDRRAISAYIRKQIMKKRVNSFCELCGTLCAVLPAERVAADIAKVRDIIDHVLGEDPHARIQIRRGCDHEFMMHVECDDPEVVEKINRSRERDRGIELTARVRERSRHG